MTDTTPTVYVVVENHHESNEVVGVYDNLEDAKARVEPSTGTYGDRFEVQAWVLGAQRAEYTLMPRSKAVIDTWERFEVPA